MRVCALQMDIAKGDRAANHATVRRLVTEAVSLCSPDVIVLPELWSTGYALEQAKELAQQHTQAAIAALDGIPNNDILVGLANHLAKRRH